MEKRVEKQDGSDKQRERADIFEIAIFLVKEISKLAAPRQRGIADKEIYRQY
jgi:hypothetical protein